MNKEIILLLLCFLNLIKCNDDLTTSEEFLYEDVDSENYIHYNNVIESLINYKNNISAPCLKQIERFLIDLGQEKEWTHQVIDSFGKPSSGLLNGFFPRLKFKLSFNININL
jgi:hypothetical protein